MAIDVSEVHECVGAFCQRHEKSVVRVMNTTRPTLMSEHLQSWNCHRIVFMYYYAMANGPCYKSQCHTASFPHQFEGRMSRSKAISTNSSNFLPTCSKCSTIYSHSERSMMEVPRIAGFLHALLDLQPSGLTLQRNASLLQVAQKLAKAGCRYAIFLSAYAPFPTHCNVPML